MLAAIFKRTKIVATVGPATSSPQQLLAIIQAGVNGIRLGFAHGSYTAHLETIERVRAISAKLEKPIAIIADLQGPKIRVGTLPADGIPLIRGHAVRFGYKADFEASGIIPIQFDFSGNVSRGQTMYLNDGLYAVEITEIVGKIVHGKVRVPGVLTSNKGINLPDATFEDEILTQKDIEDAEFAAANDYDYIALSFVQSAKDIISFKARLKRLGSDAAVIAKIETKAAVRDLEAIIQASDAVMVARGDLAIEVSNEAVPIIQRQIIDLGRLYRKNVIVATQMLESMMNSPQPTRAEVSDVANAVMYGADAVMLSGETAVGQFPVETVAMMKRVICYTEESTLQWHYDFNFKIEQPKKYAVPAAAVLLARQTDAAVIIAETSSGATARNISSFRPAVPIIMATHNRRVYNQMAIVWGGKSYYFSKPRGAAQSVIRQLKEAGNVKRKDAVVLAFGQTPGVSGGTDTIQLKIVE